jgi:hypothetical protein
LFQSDESAQLDEAAMLSHLDTLKDLAGRGIAFSEDSDMVLEATKGLRDVFQGAATTIKKLQTLAGHLALRVGVSSNRNWEVFSIVNVMAGMFLNSNISLHYFFFRIKPC